MTWKRLLRTRDESTAWILEAVSDEGRWWDVALLNAWITCYWWAGVVTEVRC